MILVSDIPGLLADKDDESSLIPFVHVYEVNSLIDKGILVGTFLKLMRAISKSRKAFIIDGRISFLIESFR